MYYPNNNSNLTAVGEENFGLLFIFFSDHIEKFEDIILHWKHHEIRRVSILSCNTLHQNLKALQRKKNKLFKVQAHLLANQ